VADRLKAAVRHADLVARMGGDEFVVVLDPLSQDSEAELVAAKILARLSEDLQLGNQRLRVTPSIGMVLCPDDGDNLADLLRNADAAMYAAKRRGGAQLSPLLQRDGRGIHGAFHHRGAAAARAGHPGVQAALPAHRRHGHVAHCRRGSAHSMGNRPSAA